MTPDPVWPHVAVSGSHDDAEHGRLATLRGVDSIGDALQALDRMVDLTGPELDLEGTPALARDDDRVDLQAGLIAVAATGNS